MKFTTTLALALLAIATRQAPAADVRADKPIEGKK
jgi:hypothetical protein